MRENRIQTIVVIKQKDLGGCMLHGGLARQITVRKPVRSCSKDGSSMVKLVTGTNESEESKRRFISFGFKKIKLGERDNITYL